MTTSSKAPLPLGKRSLRRRMADASWRDLAFVGIPLVLIIAATLWVGIRSLRFAPPGTVRMISGPEGSSYRNQAEKYKKAIERYGVKVEVLPSKGALDNLRQLADRRIKVDVGFVQGGLIEALENKDTLSDERLVSLGSLFAQPIMVYCRHEEPVELLSQLRGKRIAVGPEGSGTRVLALKILKANEMDGAPTTLLELGGEEAAKALLAGTIDAA